MGQVYRSSSVGSIYVEEAIGVIKSPNNQTYLALSQKTKDKRIQQVEYMISKLCGGDKCSLDYEEFMKDLLNHNYDVTNLVVEDKKL